MNVDSIKLITILTAMSQFLKRVGVEPKWAYIANIILALILNAIFIDYPTWYDMLIGGIGLGLGVSCVNELVVKGKGEQDE